MAEIAKSWHQSRESERRRGHALCSAIRVTHSLKREDDRQTAAVQGEPGNVASQARE
jgi:hypothetical protein